MKFQLTKFLKLSLIIGLYLLVTLIPPALNALNPENEFIPVLCYHRVGPKISSIYDLTTELFEEQLQFIKDNGYHPITALQYLKYQNYPAEFPEKPIILTFDDGNKNHYRYVYPLLKKYGFQATFFVYPEAIFEKSDRFITWNELSEMVKDGMDIESHTFSHAYLTSTKTRPDDPSYLRWLDHELKDSKKILEERLNIKVELIAYPYGWYNCVVDTKTFEADYQGAFTVNWGTNLTDENPFRLKRRAVSNNLSFLELEKYLTSKPLPLEILSPRDGAIINEKPEIRFKILNQDIHWVDIIIEKDKKSLDPDAQGIYNFSEYKLPKSGYHMIIVSGYDLNNQLYINSWGFDYQKPNSSKMSDDKPSIIPTKNKH